MSITKRLDKLEAIANPEPDHPAIILDGGGLIVTVNGREMSRAEFDRLYPPDLRQGWHTVEIAADIDAL